MTWIDLYRDLGAGRYPVQLNGVKTQSKPHKLLFMPNFNSQEGVPVKTARFLWALRFFTHNFKTFTTNFLLNGFSSFLRCPMFSIFMVPCDDGDGHNHCSDDCDHHYNISKLNSENNVIWKVGPGVLWIIGFGGKGAKSISSESLIKRRV